MSQPSTKMKKLLTFSYDSPFKQKGTVKNIDIKPDIEHDVWEAFNLNALYNLGSKCTVVFFVEIVMVVFKI